jgi:hypothetical protein
VNIRFLPEKRVIPATLRVEPLVVWCCAGMHGISFLATDVTICCAAYELHRNTC